MQTLEGIDRKGVWRNFSGLIEARPDQVLLPSSEDELVQAIRSGNGPIRMLGTGHSCTPLCATDGTLLSLDRMRGVVSTNSDSASAWIRGGSQICDLGAPLREAGLATLNQGDIDVQTLAGAISTGTHGTGPSLGNMSSAIRGLRLLLASGEVIECSAQLEPEIFRAARVSLGTLGVISEIDLQLMPAYRLHQREWKEDVTGAETFIEQSRKHRHLEIFWSPANDAFYMKSLDPTELPPDPMPDKKRECIGHSGDVFPSIREDKFNEMEYAVPEEQGVECFLEIRAMMRSRHRDVFWPLELRTLAADDIDISVACGRASVTISVHQGAGLPHRELFEDAEAVFRNYSGRPHWGKFHTLEARDLAPLYPEWERFLAIRERLDPTGRFVSPYIRRLFGLDG